MEEKFEKINSKFQEKQSIIDNLDREQIEQKDKLADFKNQIKEKDDELTKIKESLELREKYKIDLDKKISDRTQTQQMLSKKRENLTQKISDLES